MDLFVSGSICTIILVSIGFIAGYSIRDLEEQQKKVYKINSSNKPSFKDTYIITERG